MAMKLQRQSDAKVANEYGCGLRRLYPWAGTAEPLWGSSIAIVEPCRFTDPHCHDEEETFLILEGAAAMSIDGVLEDLECGDVVYIPRNSNHSIRNRSDSAPLKFLSIYWGSPEANARMAEMVKALPTP